MELPNRKSIRLKQFDYSSPWVYFVTICTRNRECIFGSIVGARRGAPVATRGSPEMERNVNGIIVENIWKSLPEHHPVELDVFQIMPNHIHGIIRITGTGRPRPSGGSRPAPTLGTIIGLFKSECTKQIRGITKNPNMPVWQRNYYEHIIRTEDDLEKIRWYVKNNPKLWHRDRNNPDNW